MPLDYDSMAMGLLGHLPQPRPTGRNSSSGRPLYQNPSGGVYSEKTVTVPLMGKWITFPSVTAGGRITSEDDVWNYLRANGPIDPITGEKFPMFNTQDEAERYARMRSRTR